MPFTLHPSARLIAAGLPAMLIAACAPAPESLTPLAPQPSADPAVVVVVPNAPAPTPGPSASPTPSAGPAPEAVITLPRQRLELGTNPAASLRFQLAGETLALQPRERLCLPVLALDAKARPVRDERLDLHWQSSQTQVASVDEAGCLIALTPGESEIAAVSGTRPELKARIRLQVAPAAKPAAAEGFDFNGDGQRDWLLGAGGSWRIYLGDGQGGPTPAKPLRWIQIQFPFGDRPNFKPGFATTAATGDLDGDGCDDIAFGHDYDDSNGEVNVIFGSRQALAWYHLNSSPLSLLAQASDPSHPSDEGPGHSFARGMLLRDLDGDGKQDLIVSDTGFEITGAVHVFSGRSEWPARLLADQASFTIKGEPNQDPRYLPQFGSALAGGDFNGDGHPDLAVGGAGYDQFGPASASGGKQVVSAGAAFVFLGPGTAWTQRSSDDAAWRIRGRVELRDVEYLGGQLGVTDLDRDSRDDLLLLSLLRHVDREDLDADEIAELDPNTNQPPNPEPGVTIIDTDEGPGKVLVKETVSFTYGLRVFYGQTGSPAALRGPEQAGLSLALGTSDAPALLTADLDRDGSADVGIGQRLGDQESLLFFRGKDLQPGASPQSAGQLLLGGSSSLPLVTAGDLGSGTELLSPSKAGCFWHLGLPTGVFALEALSDETCLP